MQKGSNLKRIECNKDARDKKKSPECVNFNSVNRLNTDKI